MSSRFTVDIDQLEQVATQLTGFIEEQLDGHDSRVAAILSEAGTASPRRRSAMRIPNG